MTRPDDIEERALRERLRDLRVDPVDDGFRAALHRRLVEAEPPPAPSPWARLAEALRRPPRLLWPASALAAAAALLLLLRLGSAPVPGPGAAEAVAAGPVPSASPAVSVPSASPAVSVPSANPAVSVPSASPTVSVPSTKVAMVRLDLAVDVAVASADIQVSLPDGLVFWSRGAALADRTFAWSQPLDAGRNEIPIAVRGLRPGRYHVTVTARVGDQLIAHDVPLEVTEG